MKTLVEQIQSAAEQELAGYKADADNGTISVFYLLNNIDEYVGGIIEGSETSISDAVEISGMISMIRVKLGFPATFHTKPSEAP